MIPIYVLAQGVELPTEGTYYIVASNGIFLRKDTGLVQATVHVDEVPFLQNVPSSATLKLPTLPPLMMARVLLFFRRIYQRYQSEAAVLLHYSSETLQYYLHFPLQHVTQASVHYDSSERFKGFQLVGTIHSHASMQAFHSGIDDADERHFDGLHITVGRLDQPYFTVSCSVVVNSQRFSRTPEETIAGVIQKDWGPPFLQQNDQFYNIVLPEGKTYRHVGTLTHWLSRVTYSPRERSAAS